MLFAIGRKSERVRVWLEVSDPEMVTGQLEDGEIAIEVAERLPLGEMSDDGSTVVPGFDPGYEMERIRSTRNLLLLSCDWTQARDTPLPEEMVAAWAEYRQALRDIPEQQPGATVETITWPIQPGEA